MVKSTHVYINFSLYLLQYLIFLAVKIIYSSEKSHPPNFILLTLKMHVYINFPLFKERIVFLKEMGNR